MTTKPYPTDLTDAEWDCLKDVIPPPNPGGRRRERDMRAVVKAIFDVGDGGIKWRMWPHEYPHDHSVYWYCSPWRDRGAWQRRHDTLRAQVRQQAGRHTHPTAGCLDSQRVKTTEGGVNAVTITAKTSKGANAMSWLTRWACCGSSSSRRLPCLIRRGPACCLRGSAGRVETAAPPLGRRGLSRAVERVGDPAYALPLTGDLAYPRLHRLCPAPPEVGGRTHTGVAQPVAPFGQRL